MLIRRLVKRIEEKEKKRDEKEVVTRDDVEKSLKAVFQFVKDKEKLLQGMLWVGEMWFAVYMLGMEYVVLLLLFFNLRRDSTSLLYKIFPLPKLSSLNLVWDCGGLTNQSISSKWYIVLCKYRDFLFFETHEGLKHWLYWRLKIKLSMQEKKQFWVLKILAAIPAILCGRHVTLVTTFWWELLSLLG